MAANVMSRPATCEPDIHAHAAIAPLGVVLLPSEKATRVPATEPYAWDALADLLTTHQPGPKGGHAWIPAQMPAGPRRAARVQAVTALVLDVEAANMTEGAGKRVTGLLPPPLEHTAGELSLLGVAAALATSHSHEAPAVGGGTLGPRYRVVIPLTRPLLPHELRPVGLYVADMLGVADCVDVTCLEPARLYFLPRCPVERLELAASVTVDGAPLDVDRVLTLLGGVEPLPARAAGANLAVPHRQRVRFLRGASEGFDLAASPLLSDPGRWSRNPYSADDPDAVWLVTPLANALTRRYVQLNPPHKRSWLVFDVARPGGEHAWEDANLPPPTWVATDPVTGYAQLAWGLETPVLLDGERVRAKPMRYLTAVEHCICEQLGAGTTYAGLLGANPVHPGWIVSRWPRMNYTLGELVEWLPNFDTYRAPRLADVQEGASRNVTLFLRLQRWACRAMRAYWKGDRGPAAWAAWLNSCRTAAMAMNCAFSAPLHHVEVGYIVRSVSRWAWSEVTPEGFSEWQSVCGMASGAARRAASADKRAAARQMAAEGCSVRQIAAKLEVGKSTVSRWVSG